MLRQQTVRGMKWLIGLSMVQRLTAFIATIVLARLLGPSAYGLFAFAMIIVASFELFKSLGIDSAVIRRNEDFNIAANTAFLIIPSIGFFLFLVLNFFAPSIGKLLNNSELISIIRILGIIFVINCFSKVPKLFLEKNMRFKEVSIAESLGALSFSVSAVIFAFNKLGVWSLVYASIVRSFLLMFFVWLFAKWKPTFEFNSKLALEMLRFGKFIFFAAVLWFIRMNLDNFLVGKLLGMTLLGFYAIAFNIANFGADFFGTKISQVMYPAYSRINTNSGGIKQVFLEALRYVSIISFPLGIGILILGGDFLSFAYGEKWIGAIPVLKVLSLLAISNFIPVITEGIFMTLNKPKYNFWITLTQVIIFFVGIYPAAKLFGLVGVGVVVTSASIIALSLGLFWAKNLLSVSFKEIFLSLRSALLASLVMYVIITAKLSFVGSLTNHRFDFILNVCIAIASYSSMLILLEKNILKQLKEIVAL